MYTCSSCSGSFPVAEVVDQQGTILCRSCYQSQASPDTLAAGDSTIVEAAAPPAPYVCSICGRQAPYEEVADQGGRVVCNSCLRKQAASRRRATAPPATRRGSNSGLLRGLLLAVAVLGFAGFLYYRHTQE